MIYPVIRFAKTDSTTILKTKNNTYITVIKNNDTRFVYKLPLSNESDSLFKEFYVCLDTLFFSKKLKFSASDNIKFNTQLKFQNYKPLYFNRFKYVGKGFKLLFKKKKNLFNCIFGYSHIYWVKLQNTFIKKTKKYKFFFLTKNMTTYNTFLKILQQIKPINRYTLRGVRTYSNVWIKRKGRKSVATHV